MDFKLIEGYENYEISNLGDVKRLSTGIILKQTISNHGYKVVTLSNDNGKKTFLVHRLVVKHFLPNIYNKPCIDHKDGNKLNNVIYNLRYATYLENNRNRTVNLNSSTGIKGVCLCKKTGKFRANIRYCGKLRYLGYYDNIQDAKKVRQHFASILFRNFLNDCEKY
jgi:hypothetical protein